MLSKAMRDFARKVSDDDKLRERIEAIHTTDAASAAALLRTIAREAGFNITDRDVLEVFSHLTPKAAGQHELRDDDLEGIAGGVASERGRQPSISRLLQSLAAR